MQRGLCTTILIVTIVILCGTPPAIAGAARPYRFFVSGEYGIVVSPEQFTDYYSTGFGFGGGVEYSASSNWSLIAMFDMKLFSPAKGMIEDWWTDEGEYPHATDINVSEGGVTAGTIAVLGKGCLKSPGSRLFPYLKGGFGLTIAGADEIKVTFDNGYSGQQTEWVSGIGAETNVSIILGFGLEKVLGDGNSSLFIDAGLHMIMQETTNPTVAPITVGIKF